MRIEKLLSNRKREQGYRYPVFRLPDETDQQFTNCIKANGTGVSVSSFFYICKVYGITLDTYHVYQKDSVLQGEIKSNNSALYRNISMNAKSLNLN